MLLFLFLHLLARHLRALVGQRRALALFFVELFLEFDARLFGRLLRAFGFLDGALLGFLAGTRFDFEAGANLRLAVGSRLRLGLGLGARGGERGFQLRRIIGSSGLGRGGRRRSRRARRGGRGRRGSGWRRDFLAGCGEIEVVVFVAEIGQRLFAPDFKYLGVAFFLQLDQHLFQVRYGDVGLFGKGIHVRLAVDGFQHLHRFARQGLGLLIDLRDALGGLGKNGFHVHRATLLSGFWFAPTS
ncbi:MAG: hypothetical protein HY255_12360 [Betaproteobacteria bacterium]|nr:hypothetical protein [Betaproteobacteria bacterium]